MDLNAAARRRPSLAVIASHCRRSITRRQHRNCVDGQIHENSAVGVVQPPDVVRQTAYPSQDGKASESNRHRELSGRRDRRAVLRLSDRRLRQRSYRSQA